MSHRTPFVMLVLSAATLAVCAAPAVAQPPGNGPCRKDLERLCPDVRPGEGRIRECLMQHESQLSPECQAHVKETQQRWQKNLAVIRSDCRRELNKFCEGIEGGQGRLTRCLRAHEAELSPECKAHVVGAKPPQLP